MTVRAATVGVEVGPVAQTIDARWLMAYAAGLGETDARYYDCLAAAGPAAHPLFAVCYEWPVALMIRAKTIDEALAPRSVHATHHLVVHRPPRAGDHLLTSARVIEVARRRSGTLVVTRFTTVDERGAPVTTTDYGSVYRGVESDGEARESSPDVGAWTTRRAHREPDADLRSSEAAAPVRWTEVVALTAGAAHVYTECARIWNPIHTDSAVATAAGLPCIILHGTATLALALSRVVARDLDGDPASIHEVAARFTGMVPLPSTLTVRGRAGDGAATRFDALDASGAIVLADGVVRSHPHSGGAPAP
ncbi:MAG: MaoC family dehydratase N-terminal domain-containing protein [Candidatus Rokubacteria bacterium]|nr:MaoC family dehydratase N-terminal domain-containing protein [Candidatus Rokubacteria bacterium]